MFSRTKTWIKKYAFAIKYIEFWVFKSIWQLCQAFVSKVWDFGLLCHTQVLEEQLQLEKDLEEAEEFSDVERAQVADFDESTGFVLPTEDTQDVEFDDPPQTIEDILFQQGDSD